MGAALALSGMVPERRATAVPVTPAALTLRQLGKRLFFDQGLSASGKVSCASCHDPAHAYAAPEETLAVMRGGAALDRWGLRSVPSLRYLAPRPHFARHVYVDAGGDREDVGPAGGYMLDGRVADLDEQALTPLLDPAEMANADLSELAARLQRLPYASGVSVRQAAAALAAFELQDPSFHPYSSRFDRYLAGRGTLTEEELAGLRLFNDPAKGNCAACHTSIAGPAGQPPQFTDYSYHALGVPRNPTIPANRDPRFFDLGLCGPKRTDLRQAAGYCGYFKTPTLRNVARRRFFFHNGSFTSLQSVLEFYVTRDLTPQRWYPLRHGAVDRFDDLPDRYRANVDISDAPLNRDRGSRPALDDAEISQVVAFLRTLNDAD